MIIKGEVDYTSDPWNKISDYAQDLVKKCLDPNPKTRYLPSDALMHPWIANHGNVSTETISETLDNLKCYKCKTNKRKDRRAITRTDDLNNVKFIANLRSKNKRFGTTVAPAQEHSESESEDKADRRERKSRFISRLKENLPGHAPKEVPKRSAFSVCKDEIIESSDEGSPELKKVHSVQCHFKGKNQDLDEVGEDSNSHDSSDGKDVKRVRKSSSYDRIDDDFFHGKHHSDDDHESSR